MRDDFPKLVIETLAKRVANHCSKPDCRRPTSGPHTDAEKSVNVGVAAHITAASVGGPRYDASMTPEERRGIKNGIWLCQFCAKLVDTDEKRYTKELLLAWKQKAERDALAEIESSVQAIKPTNESFQIETHQGSIEEVSCTRCERYGRPLTPTWLAENPIRMGSEWLLARLTYNADLQLFFDRNWCGGTWFVADERVGDGVVINQHQLADLKPASPTTTTTPQPNRFGQE
jgi:hypothetical protein